MLKIPNDALNRLSVEQFRAAPKNGIVLVLDNIRSMHNVGSAFRTADAFAIEKIVLCGITATPPHREINKAALGATESVAWEHVPDTCEAVRTLRKNGYRVFAVEQVEGAVILGSTAFRTAVLDAVDVGSAVDVAGAMHPLALIFGNELDGVAQEVIDLCDGAIEIPQWGTKHSLNISVSIGVTLWELVRTP
ncbi:MAG: RNA methyltransferase [Bacteroidales bacterium]|jgi:tRNA G18 (ribose-2'-O)-methylase SpoU|nr:RNA methyltransferase [Bacteroidales bacterium]